jgi:hypothetical protein
MKQDPETAMKSERWKNPKQDRNEIGNGGFLATAFNKNKFFFFKKKTNTQEEPSKDQTS